MLKIMNVGNIYNSKGQNGNIYWEEGISPTLSSGVTNTKGNGGIGSNNAPKVLIKTVKPSWQSRQQLNSIVRP